MTSRLRRYTQTLAPDYVGKLSEGTKMKTTITRIVYVLRRSTVEHVDALGVPHRHTSTIPQSTVEVTDEVLDLIGEALREYDSEYAVLDDGQARISDARALLAALRGSR